MIRTWKIAVSNYSISYIGFIFLYPADGLQVFIFSSHITIVLLGFLINPFLGVTGAILCLLKAFSFEILLYWEPYKIEIFDMTFNNSKIFILYCAIDAIFARGFCNRWCYRGWNEDLRDVEWIRCLLYGVTSSNGGYSPAESWVDSAYITCQVGRSFPLESFWTDALLRYRSDLRTWFSIVQRRPIHLFLFWSASKLQKNLFIYQLSFFLKFLLLH